MTDNKSYWGSYPPASVTCPGNPVQPVYSWNDDHTALVQTGEVNTDEEINAAAVGVTPYEIIDRVSRTGDESPLHQRAGRFGDVSGLPDNISDLKACADSLAASDAVPSAGTDTPKVETTEAKAPETQNEVKSNV